MLYLTQIRWKFGGWWHVFFTISRACWNIFGTCACLIMRCRSGLWVSFRAVDRCFLTQSGKWNIIIWRIHDSIWKKETPHYVLLVEGYIWVFITICKLYTMTWRLRTCVLMWYYNPPPPLPFDCYLNYINHRNGHLAIFPTLCLTNMAVSFVFAGF